MLDERHYHEFMPFIDSNRAPSTKLLIKNHTLLYRHITPHYSGLL